MELISKFYDSDNENLDDISKNNITNHLMDSNQDGNNLKNENSDRNLTKNNEKIIK